eukprot:jgi/Mesvir1/23331/Mv21027-RA.1
MAEFSAYRRKPARFYGKAPPVYPRPPTFFVPDNVNLAELRASKAKDFPLAYESSFDERLLALKVYNFLSAKRDGPVLPESQAEMPMNPPSRVVHEEQSNGNVLVKAVLRNGDVVPWLRVAESRLLASMGHAGGGLYADRFIARGQSFAPYVGRVLGPQSDDDDWEAFERMSFSGEAFQQCCDTAMDIMSTGTPDILYTWVRNTLLECLDHGDMLIDLNGMQVDGGHPPSIETHGMHYPAFYAHMANDPYGSDEEPNCIFIGEGLKATRHIYPGEEIVWDYGAPYHVDLDAKLRRSVAAQVQAKMKMINKAKGLIKFLKAHNARATTGSWPDWWVGRPAATPTRVQPSREARWSAQGKMAVYTLTDVDYDMMRKIGIDYDSL